MKKIGDSHYGEIHRRLKLVTTPIQDAACLFLENRGKQFCVDFGYVNAVHLAEGLNGWVRFKRYHLHRRKK